MVAVKEDMEWFISKEKKELLNDVNKSGAVSLLPWQWKAGYRSGCQWQLHGKLPG